jgi:hypothetical protein
MVTIFSPFRMTRERSLNNLGKSSVSKRIMVECGEECGEEVLNVEKKGAKCGEERC